MQHPREASGDSKTNARVNDQVSRPTRAEATDVANAVIDRTDSVQLTMAKICIEVEDSLPLDYKKVFKRAMETAPMPMCPLESLVCTAVKTANMCKASRILVLTKGGTTAKLLAKYRPSMPMLSVVVPEINPIDSFDWSCSDESPARHVLVSRGLVPILSSEWCCTMLLALASSRSSMSSEGVSAVGCFYGLYLYCSAIIVRSESYLLMFSSNGIV